MSILSGIAWAGNVTLAWDPNTESDLAGYKVYYGTASGSYGAPITIGTQTTYTVAGLTPGTYYFAVTAYNTSGLESGFSNEVSTTVGSTSGSICDINGDGNVNVLDLQLLVNIILGIHTPISGKGDINGDGNTNVLDVQYLANVILGYISCPIR
ncbi:MAG: dockerin type I domain-containing protein [Minisyncoccia bacterium]|jgi:hypothetical protein